MCQIEWWLLDYMKDNREELRKAESEDYEAESQAQVKRYDQCMAYTHM